MKKFILTYFLTLIFCCFNWYAKAQVFPVPKTESETFISNFSSKTHPIGENILFKGANIHAEQNHQFRAPCVDCSWEWSTEITIDNSFGASSLTNYEVMLTIDTQSFITAGQMNADGSDIRFTGNDPCLEFPHYIESGINTAATVIWVNVPNIGAGATETIYMYHGNPTATSTSDPEATFSFWEGFDDPTTNFGTSCGSYTATVAGGNLDMSWSSEGLLISDTTFPVSEVFTAEAQVNSASGNWPGIYWAKETAAKSYAMLTGGTQVRISKTGGSGGFCNGHNWASPIYTYTNASGIWSLTWQDTGNIFGEFPTVGLITSTDTEHIKDENLKLNIGGISSGSGSIQMDWIRARKYTATPPSSSTGATVTNVDTTPPTITCPGDITQDNDPGVCGANVTVPTPMVSESCPSSVATVINGPNTPFIFDNTGATFEPLLDTPSTIENVSVATSDVTLDITFSGFFGSSDACFNLEGPDGSQVFFGCNLNVLCNEIVMVNATITESTWNSWIGNYGTDLTFVLKADPDVVDLSCGGVQEAYQLTANYNIADYNLTNDFNGTADASGFYPIGTTTVIWTTTDASGNTATCTMSVTVNDTEAPIITCPTNITQNNDPSECGAVVTYADPTVSDNCTIPSTTLSGFTYLGSNQGKSFYVSQNNFNGSDALTNAIANGGYVATIEDSNQNEFLRQAVTNVGITDFVLIGFNDVSSEGNFVWHDGSATTYTNWNAGEPNNSGNEDYTLMETNTGVWNDVSTAFVIRYILQISGGIEQTSGLASGETFPVGTTTNTFVVTDASGNTATCSFDVTINDTEAPVANCAAPFTVQLDANGNASITAADIDNGSTDNCGIASTAIDITDFDCSNVGDNTVTLTVTDVNGNVSTCTTTVTVEDNVAPVANCAAAFTVQLDANGNASITVADIDNGSTDACGIASTTIDITDFDCSNVGDNIVTLTVTDVNGNVSTCTTTVTVEDNIAPTIACSADISADTDAGQCSAVVNFASPIALDNCGIDTVVQTAGLPSGSQFPVGTTTIEFTATDVNGNSSSCTFDITVTDNEAPVAICQNITIQLDEFGNAGIVAGDVDGGSTDQCGIGSLSIDIDTFDCSNVGDNNVILTVTDVNGNVSTCTAIVTVEDVTAPVVACQDITVELDPVTGTVTILGTDIDNGSTDACGIASYDLDIDTFDCSSVGDNTVVLTVTDVNGNTATCTATVTVLDSTAPVLVCQDFTIEIGPDGTATLEPGDVIASNDDACGILTVAVDITEFSCADIGTPVTVQVFSQDNNGNLATCTATVTAVDLLAPEITCPADQTVDPGPGNIFYIVPDYFATGEATATDNCTDPVTVTTQDPAPGTPLPDGTYTVTLTATDEYGNTGSCDFQLTVESVLGTGAHGHDLGSITLYPVPTGDVLNIGNPGGLDLESIKIYDLRGRLVLAADLRGMGTTKSIDVQKLAAAPYYVRITGDGGEITRRLIKQ